MHYHLNLIPQQEMTKFEKFEKKTRFAKLQNFRQLYKSVGELFTIFSKFAKYYLPKRITSEIFSDFKRKKLHFSEEVYVRSTNFNWRFKPIREMFRFFPKYIDIYLLRRMTSEIFSRFRETFWLLLLLILLLLAAINRAVVVGNGTYPNLTLPFLPILPHLTSPYLT